MQEAFKLADRITLEQTCSACPEQYDAKLDGEQIGYLRLRHGYFTVEYPDCGGHLVYETETEGDGIFDNLERPHMLANAKLALASYHLEQK